MSIFAADGIGNVHASMQYTSPKVHERVQALNEQLATASAEKTANPADVPAPSSSSAVVQIIQEEEEAPEQSKGKAAAVLDTASPASSSEQVAAVVAAVDTPPPKELPSLAEESAPSPMTPREPASESRPAPETTTDKPLEEPLLTSAPATRQARVVLLGAPAEEVEDVEAITCRCCGCVSCQCWTVRVRCSGKVHSSQLATIVAFADHVPSALNCYKQGAWLAIGPLKSASSFLHPHSVTWLPAHTCDYDIRAQGPVDPVWTAVLYS
eukprot:scaffold203_cov386-Prasinococcus_capsulatus_cf.AAC.21